MALFGIYIGNTSACIASFKKGQIEVISNDVGDRLTPSIVAYISSDLIVGKEAKQCMKQNHNCVIHSMKNDLFHCGQNINSKENSSYKMIIKDENIFYEITLNNKQSTISIVEILSSVFKKLMDCAKNQVGVLELYEAVVTVPFQFKNKQRKVICDAATLAGFKILRIINEPSAALLAYNIGQQNPQKNLKVLVMRIGGESIDLTLVNHVNGLYRIVDNYHDDKNGGYLIDDLIVEYLVNEFERQTRLECRNNTRAMFKIRTCAELCKRILSSLTSTNCSLESLHQDKDFNCALSRSRVELMAAPMVQKWVAEVRVLLQQCDVPVEDLDKIILCGGMCRMPLVQQIVRDQFPNCECLNSISPDEIYAIGAVTQASLLSGKDDAILKRNEDSNKLPCLSQDIFIELEGENRYEDNHHDDIIFGVNYPIPARKHLDINLFDGESSVSFLLKQRCSSGVVQKLAKVVINDIMSPSVGVTFHIRQDGSLHIHWKNVNDSKQQTLIVPNKTELIKLD